MAQRFTILLHDYPYWHWDFLLEHGDHALCWRLLRQPCCDEPIATEQLPPHRLLYLDYAGPVSHDRGTVTCIGSGTFEIMASEAVLSIHLNGLTWARHAALFDVGQSRSFLRFGVIPQL